DAFMGLAFTIPLLFWFWLMPNRWFRARWHRALFRAGYFICSFGLIFLLFVEYYFFEEFKSRFNTVAVDYLMYPHEVFVNIWESYHVGRVLAICAALALGWVMAARGLFAAMWEQTFEPKRRGMR